MHRVEIATNWLDWSGGSVSKSALRLRTYVVERPASPMPETIVIVFGT